MKVEKFASGPTQYEIRGMEGDMGEDTKMGLTVTEGGDVILSLKAPEYPRGLEITFNTMRGGSRNPGISERLRNLVRYLAGDPEVPIRGSERFPKPSNKGSDPLAGLSIFDDGMTGD